MEAELNDFVSYKTSQMEHPHTGYISSKCTDSDGAHLYGVHRSGGGGDRIGDEDIIEIISRLSRIPFSELSQLKVAPMDRAARDEKVEPVFQMMAYGLRDLDHSTDSLRAVIRERRITNSFLPHNNLRSHLANIDACVKRLTTMAKAIEEIDREFEIGGR